MAVQPFFLTTAMVVIAADFTLVRYYETARSPAAARNQPKWQT
jgi:hypothetical protein